MSDAKDEEILALKDLATFLQDECMRLRTRNESLQKIAEMDCFCRTNNPCNKHQLLELWRTTT
jgi:hypothetical protein